MKLLLISNSTSERGYLAHALPEIAAFADGARNGVFVPYASVTRGFDAYLDGVNEALAPVGVRLRSIHASADPARAIHAADLIVVGGGNTFQLLDRCRRNGVLPAIGERVRDGARYVGWSAGANLACPTIRTTNDMPIVDAGSLDALGLVASRSIRISPTRIRRDTSARRAPSGSASSSRPIPARRCSRCRRAATFASRASG